MKKNKFSKALKHLKSKKLDEKIKKLDEAAPTNNMSGIYQQSPRSGAGFRLGPPDPAKTFVAAADGSWPPGIPGTAGEPYYVRPPDHWNGTVDWETITTPEFGFDSAQGNNTDGLIDPVTNVVKTQLPPGSRGFILGPLVDGFVPNHISDAFTRIGYIEKDTRQFVLLGIIQGEWIGGLNDAASPGSYPVWDGSSGKFTASNPSFTLDMALWFRNEMLKNRFVKNVSYNAVGGIPQTGNPDPNAPQPLGGNGVGGGSGAAGSNPDGTGTGHGSGGDPDVGTPQGDPDPGKDPVGNDLQGLIDKALLAIDVALMGLSILGILFPEPTTSAAGAAGLAALLAKLRRLRALKAAAKAGKFKFPKFPKTPKPKFPKGKTPKPAKRPDGKPFTDPRTGKPITKPSPQTPTGDPNFKPGPLTGKPIPKPSPKPSPRPTPRPTPKPSPKPSSKTTPLPKQPLTYKQPSSKATRPGVKRPFDLPKGFKPPKTSKPKITKGKGKSPKPKDADFEYDRNIFKRGRTTRKDSWIDRGASPEKSAKTTKDLFKDNIRGTDAQRRTADGPVNPFDPTRSVRGMPGYGTLKGKLNPRIRRINKQRKAKGKPELNPDQINPGGFQTGPDEASRRLFKAVNPKNLLDKVTKGLFPKSKAAAKIKDKLSKSSSKLMDSYDYDTNIQLYLAEEIISDDEQNRRLEAMTQDPKFFENLDGIIKTMEDELVLSMLYLDLFGDDEEDVQESVITESKTRILREIRQPLKEIQELPKTTKLKGYRPNFKGKYSPQNTPDVTASKKSDQLVMAKNAEGQAWTVGDKYHKGWETTGRMNHVYARVGESDKFFEQITANNSTDVERKMQEHLNHVYHNKAMLKIDSNYQSPFVIDEQETFDNKINDPLFTKVAKRLKKEIDYPKKPAKAGYPNEAPPKIDPNTGMHPKFGKRYKYDKLDPHSAKTMAGAPTGDPEIDANVKRQAQKEDWRSDLKNLWLGSEREDWKKKIEEGMTTQVLTGILPSTGNADLETLQTGLTGNGDIDYGEGGLGDEVMAGEGEYTCFSNLDAIQNANDPNNVGTALRLFDQNTKQFRSGSTGGGHHGYLPAIPGYVQGMMRNAKPSGDYNQYDKSRRQNKGLPLTQNGSDLYYHLYGQTNDVLGLGYGTWNSIDGVTATNTGTRLDFDGSGSPRYAALKAIDSTGLDTIKIHALLGDNDIVNTYTDNNGTVHDARVQVYYWAGDHKDYVSHPSASSSLISGQPRDGWRPINLKPNGEVDPDVDPYIIKFHGDRIGTAIGADGIPYSTSNKNAPYSIPIPDYTRSKNAKYMLVQVDINGGSSNNAFSVLSVRFQRRSNVKTPALTKPLTDIETSPFVRVGPTKKNEGGKERKKKVQKIIRSGLKYTGKKFSKDFPVRTDLK